MAAEFPITNVLGSERWEGDRGWMVTYTLDLEGYDRMVELVQIEKTPAPEAGGSLYGYIDESKKTPKFRKEQRDGGRQQSFSGGRPEAQSANGGKPDEAYWEARNRAITRQHSQSVAVQLYELGRTEGVIDKATGSKAFFSKLRDLMDWLDRDVERVRAFDQPEQALPTADETIAF